MPFLLGPEQISQGRLHEFGHRTFLARGLALELGHDRVVDIKRRLHMENHIKGTAVLQYSEIAVVAIGISRPAAIQVPVIFVAETINALASHRENIEAGSQTGRASPKIIRVHNQQNPDTRAWITAVPLTALFECARGSKLGSKK